MAYFAAMSKGRDTVQMEVVWEDAWEDVPSKKERRVQAARLASRKESASTRTPARKTHPTRPSGAREPRRLASHKNTNARHSARGEHLPGAIKTLTARALVPCEPVAVRGSAWTGETGRGIALQDRTPSPSTGADGQLGQVESQALSHGIRQQGRHAADWEPAVRTAIAEVSSEASTADLDAYIRSLDAFTTQLVYSEVLRKAARIYNHKQRKKKKKLAVVDVPQETRKPDVKK